MPPTPNHHYENDRNWILLLWTFHRNHRFRCIFTMCRDTFSEKSLFHFKLSQVSFVLILSSMSGCLQARHAFIFQRNTTWPKNDALLRRKTCALLRAKTSALLRRKTCAVLRARTCALLRANTKETTKGGGRRPPPLLWRRPKEAILTRHMSCVSTRHRFLARSCFFGK